MSDNLIRSRNDEKSMALARLILKKVDRTNDSTILTSIAEIINPSNSNNIIHGIVDMVRFNDRYSYVREYVGNYTGFKKYSDEDIYRITSKLHELMTFHNDRFINEEDCLFYVLNKCDFQQ